MGRRRRRGGPLGLGFASWSGDLDRVNELLASGVPVDEYGDGVDDVTPLMVAVEEPERFFDSDQAAIVQALLGAGADVHRVDREGRTALHYAAGAGPDAVRLLLDAGADPSRKDLRGVSAQDLIDE